MSSAPTTWQATTTKRRSCRFAFTDGFRPKNMASARGAVLEHALQLLRLKTIRFNEEESVMVCYLISRASHTMRQSMFILIVALALPLAGCLQENDVPPKDEGSHVETPPPVGLEVNPARPQSTRPTPP